MNNQVTRFMEMLVNVGFDEQFGSEKIISCECHSNSSLSSIQFKPIL